MPKDQKPKAAFTEMIDLTAEELAELALKQAHLQLDLRKLEEEKHTFDTDQNHKIHAIESQLDVIAHEVSTHKREVEIETREENDLERKMVNIVRADNGALLKSRDMTLHEKGRLFAQSQPSLFDGTDPDAKPAEETPDEGDADDVPEDIGEPSETPEPPAAAAPAEKPKKSSRRVPRDLPPEPEEDQPS